MSNTQWPLRPLGSCAKFLSGGTPSKGRTEFWEGDIPWVSSGEMTEARIYDTPLHISEEGAKEGSRIVPENTVLAVVRGMSLAKEFRVSLTKREMAFNQDLKGFECADDVDSEFLFYSLFARRTHIRGLATEASHGTKRLETDVLSSFEIPVPKNKDVQKRIVALISRYDDLIENNQRRMKLMEEALRQLYREWFVRLRFPGNEHARITNGVPEEWKRTTLGEHVTLNYGKALKAEARTDGPHPVYGSSGIIGSHDKALAAAPGIVVGRKGNVGSIYWCPKDYWPIDTVYFIDAKTSNLWLYYALQHMHFISTDVAVPGLNRDFAYRRPLVSPEPRIVRNFLETAIPIHEQIAKLDEMNEKLGAARDLLLPRLMNGEIVV
jgi:type I restriction enzyme, S subunit